MMELSIVSANMWLLPPPFSVENRKRIDTFSKFVFKNKPDIVCLQEVWLNWDLKYIRQKLSWYHLVAEPGLLYNTTGLAIFSKYKPREVKKEIFGFNKNAAFYDSLGRKGYFLCKYETNSCKFSILNTQLNSPISQNQTLVLENQYNQIKQVIKNNQHNLILVGDLNNPVDDLIGNTASSNGKIKSFSKTNPYSMRGFHKFTKKFEKSDVDVDHIVLFSKNGETISKRIVVDPLVSDHYFLMDRLRI